MKIEYKLNNWIGKTDTFDNSPSIVDTIAVTDDKMAENGHPAAIGQTARMDFVAIQQLVNGRSGFGQIFCTFTRIVPQIDISTIIE